MFNVKFNANVPKTPFKSLALVSVASLFLISMTPQSAFAETKPSSKEIVAKAPADADFKKLDANTDDKLSLKEAVKDKALSSNFDVTDANKDGSISADEYGSYKAALQMKSMDSVTPNVDTPSGATSTSTPPPAPSTY